jgi:endonuclease III
MKTKIKKLISYFEKKYGKISCFLDHKNPYELITAVILSAQCTDARVNKVTPKLFKKYPTVEKLALSKLPDLENLIKSTGFYKNKAKNLLNMANQIVSNHNGLIPDDMESLLKLSGVGRKTANVVLGTAFNKAAGVVVDTHVKRISKLLGLTKSENPEEIEKDLNKIIPKQYWDLFSLWLISHGREICIARRPNCDICPVNKLCEGYCV